MIVNRTKIREMEKAIEHLGGEILVAADQSRTAIVDGQVVWSAHAGYNDESFLYEVIKSGILEGNAGQAEMEDALDR